jgi:hypothetical protein
MSGSFAPKIKSAAEDNAEKCWSRRSDLNR